MMDFSLNNTGITNSESKVVENILELDKKIPLLKYERDFMADTFAEDVLFITGCGLGIERLFLNHLHFYNDRRFIVLVINTTAEDENYFLERMRKINDNFLPKILTADVVSKDRELIYKTGGVQFITTRILMVDLLTNRIPIHDVAGIFVYQAHEALTSFQESFVLRLFREKRKSGGFVKAFSDNAVAIAFAGLGQLQRLMDKLYVRRIVLIPRFDADVKNCLEAAKPKFTQVSLDLPQNQRKIRNCLADIISTCVRELKQCSLGVLTTSAESEAGCAESAASALKESNFERDLRRKTLLLTERQERLLSDLKLLRILLHKVEDMDPSSAWRFIKYIRFDKTILEKNSGWIFTPTASAVFSGVESLTFAKDSDGMPTIVAPPKWSGFAAVLEELAGKVNAVEHASDVLSRTMPAVLVLAANDDTCRQLIDLVKFGKDAFCWMLTRGVLDARMIQQLETSFRMPSARPIWCPANVVLYDTQLLEKDQVELRKELKQTQKVAGRERAKKRRADKKIPKVAVSDPKQPKLVNFGVICYSQKKKEKRSRLKPLTPINPNARRELPVSKESVPCGMLPEDPFTNYYITKPADDSIIVLDDEDDVVEELLGKEAMRKETENIATATSSTTIVTSTPVVANARRRRRVITPALIKTEPLETVAVKNAEMGKKRKVVVAGRKRFSKQAELSSGSGCGRLNSSGYRRSPHLTKDQLIKKAIMSLRRRHLDEEERDRRRELIYRKKAPALIHNGTRRLRDGEVVAETLGENAAAAISSASSGTAMATTSEDDNDDMTNFLKNVGESASTPGSNAMLVFMALGDRYNLLNCLENLRPTHVVLYNVDVSSTRILEIFKAQNPNHPLELYSLMYTDTTEEERYLVGLRREQEAFEMLIREQGVLLFPTEYNVARESVSQLRRLSLQRDSRLNFGNRRLSNENAAEEDARPIVVVDMREFNSELPTVLYRNGVDLAPATLEVGDYVLAPQICVERKALDDLAQSLNNGRIFKQIEQMKRHYVNILLLIESNEKFRQRKVNGGPFQGELSRRGRETRLLLAMLVRANPTLSLLWSYSPTQSAELFEELTLDQPPPDVDAATAIRSDDLGALDSDDEEGGTQLNARRSQSSQQDASSQAGKRAENRPQSSVMRKLNAIVKRQLMALPGLLSGDVENLMRSAGAQPVNATDHPESMDGSRSKVLENIADVVLSDVETLGRVLQNEVRARELAHLFTTDFRFAYRKKKK